MARFALTLSELRTRIRDRIGYDTNADVDDDQAFPDEQLTRLINDAVRTCVYHGTETANRFVHDAETLTFAAGAGDYTGKTVATLPTSFVKERAVFIGGKPAARFDETWDSAVGGDNSFEIAATAQPAYRIDGTTLIGYPAGVTAGVLWFVRTPAVLSADGDLPELDDAMREPLLEYCCGICRSRQAGSESSAARQEMIRMHTLNFRIAIYEANVLLGGSDVEDNRAMSVMDLIARSIRYAKPNIETNS